MSETPEFRGRVRVYGGIESEGTEYRNAIVTSLGDEFKLAVREGSRFIGKDRLLQARMVEDEGKVTFTGVSENLVEEVGLGVDDSAEVRWELTLRGCQSCG